MTGRRLAAIGVLLVLAACAYLSARLLAEKGLSWAANVTQVASFFLTVAAALLPFISKLLRWPHGTHLVSGLTLQEASDGLAVSLTRQWAEEDKVRRTYDPYPLPVRWRPVNAAAEGQGSWEFKDIHSAFAHAQRLVILGPAGAGKSVLAIKLVRDILKTRKSGDRVPVLLPAATWTSDISLTDWIAGQLAGSQPGLDVRIRVGEGIILLASALAAGGVIPIIDGLDELPVERRAAVIKEINAHGSEYPLVLTSRPAEYHAAVTTRPVSEAVVVELQPLRAGEVKSYLTEATAGPHDRWQGVFCRVDSEPDGVLATVLANPLMIWLTRTVYEAADSHPGELLDNSRFTDDASVESHLIGGFVPAVYPRRPRGREFRCRPEEAMRWLGFLAHGLSRRAEQDIAWWRLSTAEPLWLPFSMAVRGVLYALVSWRVATWALSRRGYWRRGTYIGHGHFEDFLLDGPLGRAVRPLVNQLLQGTVTGDSARIDSVLRIVSHYGQLRAAGLGGAVGLAGGFLNWLLQETPLPQRLVLTRSVAWAVLGPWLPLLILDMWYTGDRHVSAVGFLGTTPGHAALLWVLFVIVRRVALSLTKPVTVTTALDPVVLLRADRNSYLARLARLASGFGTTWLWAGSVFAIAVGVESLAGVGIVLLLGSSSGGAWPRYLDARLRLAARGRLPWRTMSFLTDAHRRGVLRQSGATYQFRHIRLQERLADGYSPWPAPLVPVVAWTTNQARRVRALLLAEWAAYRTQGGTEQVISSDAGTFTASGDLVRRPWWYSLDVPLSAGMVLAVGLTVLCAVEQSGWMLLIAAADMAILVRLAFLSDKSAALARLPLGHWSIQVSADAIDLTRASRDIHLMADDVTNIAIRQVAGSWSCYALAARLTPTAGHREFAWDGWLPLYWAPDYSAKIPQHLVSALSAFAGERLDPRLSNWLRHQEPVEYEESGNADEIGSVAYDASIRAAFWSTVAAAVLVGLFATLGWIVLIALASVACVLGGAFLLYIRSGRRSVSAARQRLPSGPWSVRVLANAIEITRNNDALRISPAEVDIITFRPVGKSSERVAVQVRLRPGSPARGHATDGWLPIYWTTDLSQHIPLDLVAALAGFGGERLVGRLRRQAEGMRNAK